MLIEWST